MSLTLHHGEPNGPSFTVLAALFETGVEAELVFIPLPQAARHELACANQTEVAMSIEGEGPVLLVEGEGMTDSVFIACFLDDMAGGDLLRPADPYARWEMMCWCRQLIERTAPAAALLGCWAFPPQADAGALEGVASDDLRERWRQSLSGEIAEDQLADSRAKIVQSVAGVEDRLAGRDWLIGDFSIADLEAYAWLAGMVELVPEAFAGKVATVAWLDRLRARPAVQRALSLSPSGEPLRVWAPGPEINRWG